ncbi:diguanylate cyclase domain-containing protein [Pantoea sp. BAV 3049]|uniref:diguanylate cyclase domain-containing protein n=1 Tax=Pantoea sp. BAV 3049 TaxID=2654188 RepID=UPI001E47E48F|nr:diguanylate cyclase [Pantoea sp. BAV 3049]
MNHVNQKSEQKPLPTLRKSLQRIYLVIIVVSLLFSGISLSVLSMFALRSYAENNLQLVATTISYSVPQAVATGDADSVTAILQEIGSKAEFGHARILDPQGHLLTRWPPPDDDKHHAASQLVSQWLFPVPVNVPIMVGQQQVGQVWLTGSASRVLHYLSQAMKWLGGSLLVTAMLAFWLSHRMHAGILAGLQNIASVAHDVRRRRAFSQRVPSSSIAELNKLSGDFNSLLDELSDWQNKLQQENDTLAHQVRHDALTGLPNRTAFEQELQKQLGNPQTASQVAVLFIDGDRFKEVNDHYGHAAGDCVLAAMAHRLRNRLRKDDLVARLGGDEFAVLLSSIENGEQAGRVAENVIEAMREPIKLEDGTLIAQSLSVGVALAKNHSSGEAMIAQADAAMYHIKELGGGWYFSPSFWGQPPEEALKQRGRA